MGFRKLFHLGFKSEECKTSLRIALTRINVFKNKKANQIKQTKQEIARCLETGEDKTAVIKVENFITEEKIMSAYEEVEIYCKLIVAGLDTIDSQKDCPTNLKEAVAGVVFASSRLGEITELVAIRRHFASKYGNKFVKSSLKANPKSSIVSKLSEIPPNTEIKEKALTSIAAEHGIRWDSKSSEEQFKQHDGNLMDGSASSGRSHEMVAESSNSQSHSQITVKTELTGGSDSSPSESSRPRTTPRSKIEKYNIHQFLISKDYYDEHELMVHFKDAAEAAEAAAKAADMVSIIARTAAKMAGSTINPMRNVDEATTSRMGDSGKICNDNSASKEGHQKYKNPKLSNVVNVEEMADVNGINLSSDNNNLEFLDRRRNQNSGFVSDSVDSKEEEYQKSLKLNSGSEFVVKDVMLPKNKDRTDQEEKDAIIRQSSDLRQILFPFLPKEMEDDLDAKELVNENSIKSVSSHLEGKSSDSNVNNISKDYHKNTHGTSSEAAAVFDDYDDDDDHICNSNGSNQEINLTNHTASSNPETHSVKTSEPKEVVSQSDYDDTNIHQENSDSGQDSEIPKDPSFEKNAIHNNVPSHIDSNGGDVHSNTPVESKPSQESNSSSNTFETLARKYQSLVEKLRLKWNQELQGDQNCA